MLVFISVYISLSVDILSGRGGMCLAILDTVRTRQEQKSTEFTIVGSMPCPNPGETLRLRGEWVTDAKFGRQFRVESCMSGLPSTLTGIEKYLGSGLVKGIGPVMAKRVVALFGLETPDINEASPDRAAASRQS